MPNSQSRLGPDIDVKADNAYIVAPPSIVNGVRYRWNQEAGTKPVTLTANWRDAVRGAAEVDRDFVFSSNPIPEGARNTTLTQLAFELRRLGKSQEETLVALRATNAQRCKPSERDSRIVSLVGRVFKYRSLPPHVTGSTAPRELRQTPSLAFIDTLKVKPLVWAIRKMLPEGVILLAGPPKIGKSFLVLQMGLSVATGSRLWSEKRERQGDVLYITYEDTHRRIQKRARQLMHGDPLPGSFFVDYDWPRMDAGGIDDLENWLTAHPGTRLVMIDTLARFRSEGTTKRTAYDYDYDVGRALVPLAARHHVAIVLVHHTAKGQRKDVLESVNSTNGLPGGVDTVMVLARERSVEDGGLFVTGRDIEHENHWAMAKRKDGWTIIGSVADEQRSPQRKRIISALKKYGPSMPLQLTEYTGMDGNAVRQLLLGMTKDEEVVSREGIYEIPRKKR